MHGVNEQVNCMTCAYFYITWDRNFPNGCRLFEFKARKLPSQLVKESTGDNCKNHMEKKKPNRNI